MPRSKPVKVWVVWRMFMPERQWGEVGSPCWNKEDAERFARQIRDVYKVRPRITSGTVMPPGEGK